MKTPNSRLKCTEVLAKPFPTRRNSQFKKRRRIGNGRTQATYNTPFAYGVDSQCPISAPLLTKPHKDMAMLLHGLSSQVLEDLELKGRCGDLCNERFVPSSNTAVKIR